jgi:hypothetical protein
MRSHGRHAYAIAAAASFSLPRGLAVNFLNSDDPMIFFLVTSACALAFLGHSAPPLGE